MFVMVVLQEFIIHTPSEDAQKMYIGNAMKGNYAAVFAQLIINGESQGKTGYAELSSQACLHISSAYQAWFCQLSLYSDMHPIVVKFWCSSVCLSKNVCKCIMHRLIC